VFLCAQAVAGVSRLSSSMRVFFFDSMTSLQGSKRAAVEEMVTLAAWGHAQWGLCEVGCVAPCLPFQAAELLGWCSHFADVAVASAGGKRPEFAGLLVQITFISNVQMESPSAWALPPGCIATSETSVVVPQQSNTVDCGPCALINLWAVVNQLMRTGSLDAIQLPRIINRMELRDHLVEICLSQQMNWPPRGVELA
jgi:hypothetical protein